MRHLNSSDEENKLYDMDLSIPCTNAVRYVPRNPRKLMSPQEVERRILLYQGMIERGEEIPLTFGAL